MDSPVFTPKQFFSRKEVRLLLMLLAWGAPGLPAFAIWRTATFGPLELTGLGWGIAVLFPAIAATCAVCLLVSDWPSLSLPVMSGAAGYLMAGVIYCALSLGFSATPLLYLGIGLQATMALLVWSLLRSPKQSNP